MSKELIEKLRDYAGMAETDSVAQVMHEAADALEAKAAPVGEREAQRAAIEAEFEQLPYDADQRDIDRRNRVELPCFARGFTAGYQAGAAYQRAQQPQSAEAVAVAWVEVKDRHEGPYDFHGMELMDSGKHYLYTTPQPSAGVVMLSDNDRVPDDYRNQATGYRAGWNDCAARLNGKEVGRG